MAKDDKSAVAVDETAELRAQLAEMRAQIASLATAKAQGGGITADQLKEVMSGLIQMQADANLAAQREMAERDMRDDLNYPKVSAFSYPEGDRARPRPPFKCRMFWNGYDLDWDTTTARELELLNVVEPGIFTFRRIGGAPETLTVTGERNARGEFSKLDFAFPAKEQRDTLPSMAVMLRDALGLKTAEQLEIEALRAKVEALTATATVAA